MQPQSAPVLSQGIASCLGYADFVTGADVTGWAIDTRAVEHPVALRPVIDGTQLDQLRCTLPREDVREAGIPSDVGGFRFSIPARFRDGGEHELKLLLPEGGAVCFPSRDGSVRTAWTFRMDAGPRAEGCVDAPGTDAIEGWVLRRDANGAQIGGCEIAVTLDDAEITRLRADLRRDDVAQAKGCDPNVGFRFVPPPHLRTGREVAFGFAVLPERTPLPSSPRSAAFLPCHSVSRLAALAEEMDALFTQAWSVRQRLRELLPGPEHTIDEYDAWARRYRAALHARVAAERTAAETALVSIVCPVFRPRLGEFAAMVDSVRRQSHPNWELILVDDGSRSADLTACMRGMAASDPRIRVMRAPRNGGIAAATNRGIAEAHGEWVAFVDHDDLLDEVALEVMLRAARGGDARVLYSDEDKIEPDGRHVEPHLKPDWNWRLALGTNFVCHLLMVEAGLLRETGALDAAYEGAQDHDLLLRLSERVQDGQIRHVPEILYHWRKTPASTAGRGAAKSYASEAGVAAIGAHLRRKGLAAEVSALHGATFYRVTWRFDREPRVCIVIPFRDQAETTRRCVEALLSRTAYGNFRILLVDNESASAEAAALCRDVSRDARVSVLRDDLPFNYSRLNNRAVRACDDEFVLLLNNDVFVEQDDWLRRMVDEALADPAVGAVGCKLVYPDRRVQHAGVVLGVGGVADHAFKGLDEDAPGYLARAWCAQEYSAVTAACLLCRTAAFREVGGMDEDSLAVAFNDVDLCLKLRARGWRIVWTPDVVAEHHESLSRGDDMTPRNRTRFVAENQVMQERWGAVLARDPFYSRHFSRDRGLFRSLSDESLRLPAARG